MNIVKCYCVVQASAFSMESYCYALVMTSTAVSAEMWLTND